MLRIATWTLALRVLALATPSAAIDLCAKLDGKTGEVKDGSSVKLRTLCKTKNAAAVFGRAAVIPPHVERNGRPR